jgi:hypothetical protein
MRGVLAGVRNELVNTGNCGVSTDYDAGISAISTPNGTLCQTTFTPSVTLNNYGSTTLTSVQIQYFVDAGAPSTYNWSGSLASNSSTTVTLNAVTTTAGAHTFTARTVSGTLNGSNNDQETSNDQTISSFSVATGGSSITLTLALDCFGEEITWEIRSSSNQVVASGGPYVNNASGEQIIESLCLAEDCYDFNIFDSFGDGLYGSQWQSCSINGDYAITDGSTTLVQLTAANSDFGTEATHNFCIGGGSTSTCEDLMTFDGSGFTINNLDFPNFEAQIIDNDQEAVNSGLATAGFTSEWMAFYEEVSPGDTNFFIGATSWFANTSAPADNWITFGPVTMTSDGGEIRWKHRMSNNGFRDGYELLLNTNGTDISDFSGATVLYTVDDNDPSTDGDTTWTQQVVALPAGSYAGQELYFGFHHNALDMEFLFLDDMVIEGCSTITVDIGEIETFNMNVFPNPSSNNFTFQYLGSAAQNFEFVVLNSVGQQVWSKQVSGQTSGTAIIETGNLSSGVYTLVVRGDKLNVSERLILTK